MKIRIIKKLLSALLITASLATPFSFASAEGSEREKLNSAIKQCDEIIADCRRTKEDLIKERDDKIKSIRQDIKNNLATLEMFKEMLREKEISENDFEITRKDLEEQNKILFKKIALIEQEYQEKIKPADEICRQQANEKKRFESILDKLDKEAFNLVQQIRYFREMCFDFLEKNQNVMHEKDRDFICNGVMDFESNVNQIYQKDKLNEKNINEFKKELENLKNKFNQIYQKNKAPNKPKNEPKNNNAIINPENEATNQEAFGLVRKIQRFREKCCAELSDQNFKDKVRQFESGVDRKYSRNELTKKDIVEYSNKLGNLKNEFSELKWKQINSGSQVYNCVKGNLCWLHSATNVLNYYNNIDNKGIIKGSKPMVDQYKKVLPSGKKNIDGVAKEFGQIGEYLNKCQIGTFHMKFYGENTNKQKIMDSAKKLLKTHFKSNNQSPVIGHIGGANGHFVTIADYNEQEDKFLVVDSSNGQRVDARVEWQKSESFELKVESEVVKVLGFLEKMTKTPGKACIIELMFTSKTNLNPQSLGLNIQANKIIQTDLNGYNGKNTSIQKINNIIANY